MITYIQRYDDQWVDMEHEQLIVCCDCGLAHRQEYALIGDHILRKCTRDNRVTAYRRRTKAVKESIKALKGK